MINGKLFDPDVPAARPRLGEIEAWTFENSSGGWSHPIHVHDVTFQILSRNGGPPRPTERGWRDAFELGPNESVKIAIRFTDCLGKYVFHCHNLAHEDTRMMARFDVVP